jgi:hypothetical protein
MEMGLILANKEHIPYEAEEQASLVSWLYATFGREGEEEFPWYAIPNGEYRPKIIAAKLKKTGVKPGVPDLCFALPKGNFSGLYIEMKRIKGASTSKNQDHFISLLQKFGYKVVICRGAANARQVILDYLAL